jgi:subtilisin family serine protease/subtilisin-like proprotein convertase family protein
MRFTSRTWFLLSLLFLVGAVFFWLEGNKRQVSKEAEKSNPTLPSPSAPPASTPSAATTPFQLQMDSDQAETRQPIVTGAPAQTASADNPSEPARPMGAGKFPLRLSNSKKTIEELTRTESALLLRNAFLDTEISQDVVVPEHLRVPGDTRSFIVQSKGPITEQFRAMLADAEASIVSYIPNNAYLVRVSPEGARLLATAPATQAVLPYEPYYKLDHKLLGIAVDQQSLPDNGWLQVTLFSDDKEAGMQSLRTLGADVLGEDRSPFGPQVIVRARPDSLPQLAQIDAVQGIEPYFERRLLNDRTRVRVGVSTNTLVPQNYLGLTGSNAVVNVVDSGVDSSHPDLAGRVFAADPNDLTDFDGHGTHVIGTIAGSGSQSGSIGSPPDGSVSGANFRGMAPSSRVFVLPLGFYPPVTSPISDSWLIETAARTNVSTFRRTNSYLISNNSWGYVGATEYDSSAARYDEAVRDAVPGMTNSQPVIYVFAAGNSGEGSDNGLNGDANSLSSPATAKNVISVGAIETFRFLTNEFVIDNGDGTFTTNKPFLGMTDSDFEVASFSSRGNVGIGTEGQFGRFKPDIVAPGVFAISARSKDWRLENEVSTNSPLYQILQDLNGPLGPFYRYSSGTSMSAPAVAGMIALMQEFFETRLPFNIRRTNSPAMVKALLINGARSVAPIYDFQVQSSINYQGWGLVNFTNSVPTIMSTRSTNDWPVQMIDQHPALALTTGERRSWNVTLSGDATQFPLRVTLVWTDPPGNPSAAVKLVNDLDLVVSNTLTKQVFYGNNIPVSSDFTQPTETNSPPVTDVVNNVENVFIRDPGATNWVVSVVAKRVNVNSVYDLNFRTRRTNDVAQDFALVISSGNTTLTNGVRVSPRTVEAPDPLPEPQSMTNGVPLLNQRVGAHSPIYRAASTNGLTNQWSFYIFTNIFITNDFSTLTNGTNVAFVTFLPPDLARPRNSEGDVDLYVSRNQPGLLQLDPAAFADSETKRSLRRGGTEFVVYTNAAIGDVFYIGVKSEDHQGGEFGLIAISSNDPFDEDVNGSRLLRGYPTGVRIPDGSANQPDGAIVLALGLTPVTVQRAVVTNTVVHENFGDLFGQLSHDGQFAVLNNHTFGDFFGTNTFIYDDSGLGDIAFSQPTDGPGSLNNFVGQEGMGVWMLNMIDNSPTHTGRVESLRIRLDPLLGGDLGAFGPEGVDGSVGPGQFIYYFIDVPLEATNLIIRLSKMTGPLEVYLRRDLLPTRSSYDKFQPVNPPGGDVTLSIYDQPNPLTSGRYFIGLYNPGSSIVNFHIAALMELDLTLTSRRELISPAQIPIRDFAVTNSIITVRDDLTVEDLSVGVRVDHPRVSDLVMHLVSPQGKRILLAENRGGLDPNGYGMSILRTNSFSQAAPSEGSQNEHRFRIQTGTNQGTIQISYDFLQAPDSLRVRYEGSLIFDTGLRSGRAVVTVNYGPGNSTDVDIIMNEGGSSQSNTRWSYTASLLTGKHYYAVFTENTNAAKVPIKFATPPFRSPSISTGILMSSSFEGLPPGLTSAGGVVDGWSVLTNQVEVLTGLGRAHTGVNLLDLTNGVISRVLPTTIGKEYRLTFASRRSDRTSLLGWWPGEGDGRDILNGNNALLSGVAFAPAQVGRGFQLDGQQSAVIVPDSDTLDFASGTSFSLEAWIRIESGSTKPLISLIDKRLAPQIVNGVPNGGSVGYALFLTNGILAFELSEAPLAVGNFSQFVSASPDLRDGQFHHVVVTVSRGSTSAGTFYIDGLAVGSFNPSVEPGTLANNEPFRIGNHATSDVDGFAPGIIDEVSVYGKALTAAEVLEIFNTGTDGKCGLAVPPPPCPIPGRFVLNGQTNYFIGATDWQTNITTFVATTSGTILEVNALDDGLWVDSFELEETGQIYYLPEESLKLLRGERTLGDWKLEIWDNRLGPTNLPLPMLVSWQLNLKYAGVRPEQKGIFLTNGVPYSGVLATNQTNYFIVDVCNDTTFTFNLLSGPHNRLQLLADRSGFPTGDSSRDDFEALRNNLPFSDPPPQTGFAFLPLGTNVPMPAPLQPGKRYYLAVHNIFPYETNDYTISVQFDRGSCSGPRPIVRLNNDVPYTNAVPPSPAEDFFDYYVFNVSSNAASVRFELVPQNGDLGLVAKKAPILPDLSRYDYISDDPGIVPEVILFGTNSLPVALTPGDWYLGVYNHTTNLVSYTITATESLVSPINVITLTNEVALDYTNAPGRTLTNLFKFSITNDAPAVLYELYNTSGRGDLVVDYQSFPSDTVFFRKASAAPSAPARIVIRANENSGSLIGDWFLAVVNRETTDLAFTIKASLLSTNITITPVDTGTSVTNTIPANEIDYYEFQVSSNALYADFELFPFTGDVDLVVSKDLPLPTDSFYAYRSDNGGTTNEFVRVTANSSPTPLSPGTWYLGILNRESNPVTYSVRATEVFPTITTLTNGVVTSATIPSNEFLQYYKYTVSRTAARAHFELLNQNGALDLYLRYGLPLPGPGDADYDTTTLTNTVIVLRTNTFPIPLAQGDWYLSVSNRENRAVTYQIRATEFTALNPPKDILLSPFGQFTANGFVINWTADPNQRFQVQWSDVIPPNWQSFTNVVTSTTENYTFTDDGTQSGGFAPFRMYRLRQLP